MKDAFIFDIDGTLADTEHRIHFIKGDKDSGKRDWKSFFAAAKNDKPFIHTQFVFDAIEYMGEYEIYFITGRPESERESTETWLHKYGFSYNGLHMRPNSERKPDYEVKRDIYREYFKDKINVLAVFEDRLPVAKMWREEGVPVFLCGDEWLKGDEAWQK